MLFTIHEEEEKNVFITYTRNFNSLDELMNTITKEWWWSKVEISTTFRNEITLTFDDSTNDSNWNN